MDCNCWNFLYLGPIGAKELALKAELETKQKELETKRMELEAEQTPGVPPTRRVLHRAQERGP